jgi:hypothetical protein
MKVIKNLSFVKEKYVNSFCIILPEGLVGRDDGCPEGVVGIDVG